MVFEQIIANLIADLIMFYCAYYLGFDSGKRGKKYSPIFWLCVVFISIGNIFIGPLLIK
jgi:hypothetical protein